MGVAAQVVAQLAGHVVDGGAGLQRQRAADRHPVPEGPHRVPALDLAPGQRPAAGARPLERDGDPVSARRDGDPVNDWEVHGGGA